MNAFPLAGTPTRCPRRRARGIATVLTMLLMGLGMAAAAIGVAMQLRGTQAQAMTLNAQTRAQMKAWTGTEVVRQFVATLDSAQRNALVTAAQAGGATLAFGTLQGIEATVLPASGASELHVAVTGVAAEGTRAEATSTVLAVFAMDAGGAGGGGPPVVLNFNRNLKLGGSITVLKDASSTTAFEINVNGDLSTGGNSITGVDTIRSTGTINIGSGSSFGLLHANCDVVLSGSVKAVTVKARRHYCASGTAAASGEATANGSIKVAGGYSANGTLQALDDVQGVESCQASGTAASSTSTVAATCAAPTVLGVDLTAGGSGAGTVRTAGHVRLDSGRIGTLAAGGNLHVNSSGTVDAGSIGGTLTKPTWNHGVQVSLGGSEPALAAVTAVSMPSPVFDAYEHEGAAHYAFRIDAAGFRTVTVSHVSGVADGTYYLGRYASHQLDHLCTALASGATPANPTCSLPAASASRTLCKGYSAYNGCISHTAGTGTWRIDGTSIAPGIAWFEGNLEVASGTYYNTFIATGHIVTSGSHKTFAPHYAGYDGSAAGQTRGICSNDLFPDMVPVNLCDTPAQRYLADNPLGHYAYMAGSRDPAAPEVYVGGDVTLGASTVAHGSVLAGNQFRSGGSTTIKGYASALGLGAATQNSMGGSTTFDLRSLPSTFQPAPVPQGSGAVSLKYARYR